MERFMEFLDKVAVVTGGGKGIGREIALSFARSGADVAIVGRDVGALGEVRSEIEALGRQCLPVCADLTVERDVAILSGAVLQRFGNVDIVVTAAGLRDRSDRAVEEINVEQFEHIVRANLLATVLPIRAFLPHMIKQRRGKVVTISGVFGLRGRARHSAGASSKWAIEGFARSLAIEVGPSNINVNSVCPGYVTGPRSTAGMAVIAERRRISAAQVQTELEEQTALKRLSSPEDVAQATLFLASDKARNITGQDLVVDAGWML